MRESTTANRRSRGFTLLEAIAVIVITGIIAAVVAVFMQKPVQGYFSSTARLAMADTADTALRRIARDVRLALPNTVRVDASGMFLEFIPIKTGGRYLDNDACFVSPGCTSLSTMGDMLSNVQIATGSDQVSIYSQYNNSPVELRVVELRALQRVLRKRSRHPGLGHRGGILQQHAGIRQYRIRASGRIAYTQDLYHFGLARDLCLRRGDRHPVADFRVCPPGRAADEPGAPLRWLGATSKVPLATNVSCPAIAAGSPPRFSYAGGASERYSLLSAWITLTNSGETVSLLHQIHVDNTP